MDDANDKTWKRAQALEASDQVIEAIQLLQDELQGDARVHQESQISYLLEWRATRLAKQGRLLDAQTAATAAVEWAWKYASGATGSGEGIALSEKAKALEMRLQALIGHWRTPPDKK